MEQESECDQGQRAAHGAEGRGGRDEAARESTPGSREAREGQDALQVRGSRRQERERQDE